jgi:hypothetical protein
MLQKNVGGGWLARVAGGRGWEPAASIGLQGKFCVHGTRVMGVSMVTTAWGEGVNVCLPAPPPP